MKPLVIYHANCTDGFSAAWVFHHRDPNGYDFHPGSYGSGPPDVTGREVYLVDFSYPRAVLREMARGAATLTVLDHHKTAQADLEGFTDEAPNATVVFDMDRSGCAIAWDFMFPNQPRPLLLGHVQDRDLWKFKLDGTRNVMAYVFSFKQSFETWDRLMAAAPVELVKMTAAGSAIERKHAKDVAEAISMCQRSMVIGGHTVPAAGVPTMMASDAGNLMAQGKPFAACYYDTHSHRCFSLCSSDAALDVSVIAKEYGGGGHRNAAGFRVERTHPLATS
jgi:oligoribonuclease NrnB/cAMP/cGMP phosphodiesterase (DHH superfamily)